MDKYAIKVEHLTRDYNGLRALDGINFSVEHGEVFGFLGPNGAGKTTTIRILTGQLRPTSGQAWVLGCDVVDDRQKLKPQIGVVFEYQNLYERLSARDNLNFAADLYGVPRFGVDQILEQVGLKDRAHDNVKKYSNGMKQRLLIARALLHQPQVLFLDEPTRGLDPHLAREIRTFVATLAHQGVTVFLTTHYMEEADQLCDRVAILEQGTIVALDTPASLKNLYGNGEETTLEDVFITLTGHSLVMA
jgi:ABC-2 type transport system ATP-binding protein